MNLTSIYQIQERNCKTPYYTKQDLLWQYLSEDLFVATKVMYPVTTFEGVAIDKHLVASYAYFPLIVFANYQLFLPANTKNFAPYSSVATSNL